MNRDALAIIDNVSAVPAALVAWRGMLWKKAKDAIKGPTTPLEWIVTFFCATLLSVIFVAIDFVIRHPGLSFAFTIATITLSFVALPGSLPRVSGSTVRPEAYFYIDTSFSKPLFL